jgi:hypothetical protein
MVECADIVLPAKPSRTITHAGTELQKYLKQMTGEAVIPGENAGKADTVLSWAVPMPVIFLITWAYRSRPTGAARRARTPTT